ncbi:hypothetical protein cypCar_00048057, partial [Cyprinus carpio]
NPRLSSIDIEQKMASRRLIKLSQLPDRLARDNLEDSDWVTFAVMINKITPQSKSNLCLTVDHPQKVLIVGEAMDFGTCKANKKNGDSCTQLVNMYECQYCQYHIKAQYKKMSSKRSGLQSSFTGSAPGKGRGRGSLRERLCQSDFHYGGMSSLACAPSASAPQPKKKPTIESVLASIPAKKLVLYSGEVSGCSGDFKGLMSMPTPGALNIKKHLGQAKNTGNFKGIIHPKN